jgi:hypothetical protein
LIDVPIGFQFVEEIEPDLQISSELGYHTSQKIGLRKKKNDPR